MSPTGKAFIKVEDNGIGMSPDIRKKIFIPFFTTKKKVPALVLDFQDKL